MFGFMERRRRKAEEKRRAEEARARVIRSGPVVSADESRSRDNAYDNTLFLNDPMPATHSSDRHTSYPAHGHESSHSHDTSSYGGSYDSGSSGSDSGGGGDGGGGGSD